jgi:copper(I)-binding protein
MKDHRFLARALMALLAVLFAAGLTACGDDGDESTVSQSGGDGEVAACDDLEAVGAFVRLPPGDNTAVYLDLTNNGDTDTALVGASADFAETFELHEMVADDEGVMEMRPIDGQTIPLPAGETVTLEPGGLHVMALGVTTELAEGDVVPVTLEFEGGCTITVDAEVRALDMPMEDMPMDESGDGMSDDGMSEEMSG